MTGKPNSSKKNATLGPFDRTILDALSAHIAILDADGVILVTNKAWNDFGAANDLRKSRSAPPLNYLTICDQTKGNDAQIASKAAAGIRDIIAGKRNDFAMEYPCHSPVRKMWFYLRVAPIIGTPPFRAAVSHEDVTPLKQAEETIRLREEELQARNVTLAETNTALKVLLKKREEDKIELETNIVQNVKEVVFPVLQRLKNSRMDARQKTYLDLLESHLDDIVSPFLRRLSALHLHLTPQEIQVATLVKEGRSTKEISDIMGISTNAVDFHRKNIRKKFGLTHRNTNLRSFLMSLSY